MQTVRPNRRSPPTWLLREHADCALLRCCPPAAGACPPATQPLAVYCTTVTHPAPAPGAGPDQTPTGATCLISRVPPLPRVPAARYGVGKRISLKHTRAILDAIHSGALEQAEYATTPVFGLQVRVGRGRRARSCVCSLLL